MSHYWFTRQELLEKAKDRYHNCGGKKKLLSIILLIRKRKKRIKNKYRN